MLEILALQTPPFGRVLVVCNARVNPAAIKVESRVWFNKAIGDGPILVDTDQIKIIY